MVLISRVTASRLLSVKQKEVGVEVDDSKKRRRQRTLWHHLVRTDTFMTRCAALLLLVANLLLLFLDATPPLACTGDAAISSFAAWMQYTQQQQQDLPAAPRSNTYCWKSSHLPTDEERAKFYMGKWWEPELQGVPPASPFGPLWKERWLASSNTVGKAGVRPMLDMEPRQLYDCSISGTTDSQQGEVSQLLCASDDDSIRSLAHSVMGAALLFKEFQERNNYWWHVWRYEGILGILTEATALPKRPLSSTPPYLWNRGAGVSVATTLWNTATPIFGRVRDTIAEEDHFRNQRRSSAPLHSTILWPLDLQRKKKEVMQQLINKIDLQWDQKEGTKLYWRGDTHVGEERRAYIEYYKSSAVIDLAQHSIDDGPHAALQHKYLLVLEGTDVPDDLLRKLYSNSVVFMPAPTYASWAMETLLQPYIHYIPVDDRSRLEEQLHWAKTHPAECQDIAAQSTHWVHDLLSSQDEQIMRTMIHRYQQFVIRAKPIVQWGDVWAYVVVAKWSHLSAWFAEDWLRVIFVVVLLGGGYGYL